LRWNKDFFMYSRPFGESKSPAKETKMTKRKSGQPLVYSCSGCSSAAQMANHVAVRLDRAEEAEMSCIAGVGGDVPSLVKVAKSGRPILAIDGCSLRCVERSLAQHGVSPLIHLILTDIGIEKRFHMEFDEDEAMAAYCRAVAALRSNGSDPCVSVSEQGSGSRSGDAARIVE
jgi:uncharacterized metal-binding protein